MATGYHDFTAGETLTAANLEDYCEKQSVMVFASAAARNAALAAVLQEGMCAFLQDVNSLTVYSGAAWSTVGPVHGALTSWTPTWTQGVTITKTVNQATYTRVGRLVTAWFRMTATSAGTAANPILMGLPVACANNIGVIGSVSLFDVSASNFTVSASAYLQSTTTFGIIAIGTAGVAQTPTIASPDGVEACVTYEAAADA